MKRSSSAQFFCFSPPVMLGTFMIEYALAAVTLIRYRTTQFGQLLILTLIGLGTFQLAEFEICTGSPSVNLLWTKIGLGAITILPPLGLHIIATITKKSNWTIVGDLLAFGYLGIFLLLPQATTGGVCSGNYVIIPTQPGIGWTYGIYYFGLLVLGISQAWSAYAKQKLPTHHRQTLLWLITGYLTFMGPMAVAYLASPVARSAVPSVMCGFALLFALIIGAKILPIYHGDSSADFELVDSDKNTPQTA